jgi:hypothetical protein
VNYFGNGDSRYVEVKETYGKQYAEHCTVHFEGVVHIDPCREEPRNESKCCETHPVHPYGEDEYEKGDSSRIAYTLNKTLDPIDVIQICDFNLPRAHEKYGPFFDILIEFYDTYRN